MKKFIKIMLLCLFAIALICTTGFALTRGSDIASLLLGGGSLQTLAEENETPPPTPEVPEETSAAETPKPTIEPTPEVTEVKCKHKFKDGVCTICGEVCRHEQHDQMYHRCLACGELVTHQYVSARCVVCGSAPNFSYNVLPDDYYTGCDEQGTVETLKYKSSWYSSPKTVYDREALIYLPYGYDPANKYNVVVLVHGMGGAANSMITRVISYNGKEYRMCNLYDRMIMEKECEPFIGVAINTRIGSREAMYEQIAKELKYDLLPLVAEKYSTYAEEPTTEGIIKARQHFGMAGFSMGSIYTVNSGLGRNLDIFGNFGAFGGITEAKSIAKEANSERYAEYPIYCMFVGAGIKDGGNGQQFDDFQWIYDSTPRMVTGINTFYISPEGSHEWKVWVTEMYNALQIMFQGLDEAM